MKYTKYGLPEKVSQGVYIMGHWTDTCADGDVRFVRYSYHYGELDA